MAINCNQINTTIAYLKLQFSSCKPLRASDMQLIVDLIDAVAICSQSEDLVQNNLLKIVTVSYDSTTDILIDEINSNSIEVSETEILIINVTDTSDNSVIKYISKIGKGTYGTGGTPFILSNLEPFNSGITISNTSELTNDGADGTSTYVETDELGEVAFSNDYNDLDNLPIIPNAPTGFEAINEGNGVGWRLIGKDPTKYGNVGLGAVDGSHYDVFGTTFGATGNYSTAFGIGAKARSWNEFSIGGGTNYTPVSTTGYGSSDRLFNVGLTTDTEHDFFTILKSGNVGIGYDNYQSVFESGIRLQVNGLVSTSRDISSIEGYSNGKIFVTKEWVLSKGYGTGGSSPTTKAGFNTALTDGDFLFIGDITDTSEWATSSGTRAGSDLITIIGDYDDSGTNYAKIEINNVNNTVHIQGTGSGNGIDVSEDILIRGNTFFDNEISQYNDAKTFVTAKINPVLTANRTTQDPDASGTYALQEWVIAQGYSTGGTSPNLAFQEQTYSSSLSVAYNELLPNSFVNLTGNTSVTITDTVNGDAGMFNFYTAKGKTITLNGFGDPLVIPSDVESVYVSFIHDNEGIKWERTKVETLQELTPNGTTTVKFNSTRFAKLIVDQNEVFYFTAPDEVGNLVLLLQDTTNSFEVTFPDNVLGVESPYTLNADTTLISMFYGDGYYFIKNINLYDLPAYSPNDFVTEWTTTTDDETITIPLLDTANYDIEVIWEDGVSDTYNGLGSSLTVSHEYPTAGTHQVIIKGTWKGINNPFYATNTQLTNVVQWGTSELSILLMAGYSNLDISATDIPNVSALTSLEGAFKNNTSLTQIPNIGNWLTGLVENFSDMLSGCTLLIASGISTIVNLNTSSATEVVSMFGNSPDAFNFNAGLWDWSNITDAIYFNNTGTAWSTTNYDATLNSIASQAPSIQSGVTIWAGSATIRTSASNSAYTLLTGTYGWTIVDSHGTNGGTI